MVKKLTRSRKQTTDPAKKKKHAKRFRLNAKKVTDPLLKQVYDQKLTMPQNREKLEQAIAEGEVVKPEKKSNRKGETVNEWDLQTLQRLEKKHGRDYEAMAVNIKINRFQWTARQIEKKFALLDQGKLQTVDTECASGMAETRRRVLSKSERRESVWKNRTKYDHKAEKRGVSGRHGW